MLELQAPGVSATTLPHQPPADRGCAAASQPLGWPGGILLGSPTARAAAGLNLPGSGHFVTPEVFIQAIFIPSV